MRLSGVFESQRQGLPPYRPWDIGEMIDSNDPVGGEWFFAISEVLANDHLLSGFKKISEG